MEGSETVRRDHQKNKSEIVNLVKDEELVKDVIAKIKLEKGMNEN